MEVKLDKRYPLPVEPLRAWAVLRDVRAVSECMPGASITEQVDATHFKGAVKVKVGPANAAFAGDIEVLCLDEAARLLQLLGKGADRGGSSASMDLTATVEPGESASTSVLVGRASVIVNGKFAQFGGRLMVQVSDMLLAQFAQTFLEKASALPPSGVEGAAPLSAEAPAGERQAHALQADPAAAVSGTDPAPPLPVTPADPLKAPIRASEINALAVVWHLMKGWIAGLFGGRRA